VRFVVAYNADWDQYVKEQVSLLAFNLGRANSISDLTKNQLLGIRRTLLNEGNIPAIKLVREITAAGLLEAKQFVDTLSQVTSEAKQFVDTLSQVTSAVSDLGKS
jgi:ribosomal protein L7/L12